MLSAVSRPLRVVSRPLSPISLSKSYMISSRNYEKSALHHAVCARDIEEVTRLLKTGADVDAEYSIGMTPVYLAARWGFEEGVGVLIEAGANLAIRDKNGKTPRCLAADRGHAGSLQLLEKAEAEADLGITDNNGKTPRCLAVDRGHAGRLQLFSSLWQTFMKK